jgi:kynureninase
MNFEHGREFAARLDREDALARWRDQFHIPEGCVYLCGNSLGLQPKSATAAVMQELEDWQRLGVEGHLHARNPWMPYHQAVTAPLARLVGAKPAEVVAMNGLTVNLHLMMTSFYRPTSERHTIIIEANAFPSDRYAVESQIRFHGYDPATALLILAPRDGEVTLRDDDVLEAIARHGGETALVLIGGVNYYTGQLFDMENIARAARKAGCCVGFDLAHAAGNVPLLLHDWGADFCCWCSYKYLNAGPGSVAGCFVHERHASDFSLPRFAGWWGHDQATRFQMGPEFHPMSGAEGWQLSNPPILSMAALKASLEIFDEAGIKALREKSLLLTGYTEFLLQPLCGRGLRILTPDGPERRGCQLSLTVAGEGRRVFDSLIANKMICDWREPDCIRVAPVPLYNNFTDVFRFVEALAAAVTEARC